MPFRKCLICLLIIFSAKLSIAQRITTKKVNNDLARRLSKNILRYSLFKINTQELQSLKPEKDNAPFTFSLALGDYGNFQFSLRKNDILRSDYKLTTVFPESRDVSPKPSCITFSGELLNESNSQVRLTITPEIIYGVIKRDTSEYFIEPLQYVIKEGAPDVFIIYEKKDVIIDPSLICGVTETERARQKIASVEKTSGGVNCRTAEIAIASDASMFSRYGSASAVATHNIGVMNNVIWDYTNAQFPTNIEFLIAGQNVSTTQVTDQLAPAYAGTKSATVLDNFKAWGEAGSFGFNYDLAQFWTTRNLDNDGAGGGTGTVGFAYVAAVCGPFKYHILEDFSGSNPSGSGYALEILTAHEIGHNFGCQHDPTNSPYIMAPSVTDTHTWSNASISAVEAFVSSVSCLSSCSTQRPLVADFITTPAFVCIGNNIQIIDRTLGGPVSWNWTAQGGTPASSTARNPTVSFSSAGLKNIILETHNGLTSDVIAKSILITSPPTASCFTPGTGTSNAGIKSFSLNTISKATGGVADDGNQYLDFSCSDNTVLRPNTTYSATAVVGTSTPSNQFNIVQLFIDYNNDGDFNDANEAVYSSTSCYIGSHEFSFTTPAAPPLLDKMLRLRVIAKECMGGVPNACYAPINGQVEDYAVIFLSNTPSCTYNYWTGSVSNAWENVNNWSCGSIPNNSTNVIITADVPNLPVINSNATAKSVYNASGTTLNVRPGFTLIISGSN